MKRILAGLAVGALAMQFTLAPATAHPPFKKAFDDRYGKNYDEDTLKTMGCNSCHVKGEGKNKRNSYGHELHEELEKLSWKGDDVKAAVKDKGASLTKLMQDLEKSMDAVEKKKTKEGETFGDRIKAGKTPGG